MFQAEAGFTIQPSTGSKRVASEAMAHDFARAVLRMALERKADSSAVILDSRTVQSTPESGARAGFDGHIRVDDDFSAEGAKQCQTGSIGVPGGKRPPS